MRHAACVLCGCNTVLCCAAGGAAAAWQSFANTLPLGPPKWLTFACKMPLANINSRKTLATIQ